MKNYHGIPIVRSEQGITMTSSPQAGAADYERHFCVRHPLGEERKDVLTVIYKSERVSLRQHNKWTRPSSSLTALLDGQARAG